MENFFELMSKEILPAIRALMAKRLLDNGFSQKDVAGRLGLTQPAISQYKRAMRGTRADSISGNPKTTRMVNELAKRIGTGEISAREINLELLDICRTLLEE